MLGWFQARLPREENILRLFAAHAATLILVFTVLRAFVTAGRAGVS